MNKMKVFKPKLLVLCVLLAFVIASSTQVFAASYPYVTSASITENVNNSGYWSINYYVSDGSSASFLPENVGYGYYNQSYLVKSLQYFLNAYGYNLVTDGIFGTNTYNAIRAFQDDHGLVVSGVCNEITWRKLVRDL